MEHWAPTAPASGCSAAASAPSWGGAVWHAKVMSDDFSDAASAPGGAIKPCRPMPMVKVSDLLAGLELEGGRWLLRQRLNGWPGLVDLELVSLTRKRRFAGIPAASEATSSLAHSFLEQLCCLGQQTSKAPARAGIERVWAASSGEGLPDSAQVAKGTRATLVAPAWTMSGFIEGSEGFVWWFTPRSILQQIPGAWPSFLCGEQMVTELERADSPCARARAVACHAFAHRYPVEKETLQDRQTYHAGVLVVWDHGRFSTVVELAFLYGCSGYSGRSNWCEDKLETMTELFEAMPDELKCPWDTGRSEIRAYDVPMRSKAEFESYLAKYSTLGGLPPERQRFLEPCVYASSKVRLRYCTRSQLAGYLLNYISDRKTYKLLSSNCQTFCTDLFSFLSGERSAIPYGLLVQANYSNQVHSFLYRPGCV